MNRLASMDERVDFPSDFICTIILLRQCNNTVWLWVLDYTVHWLLQHSEWAQAVILTGTQPSEKWGNIRTQIGIK